MTAAPSPTKPRAGAWRAASVGLIPAVPWALPAAMFMAAALTLLPCASAWASDFNKKRVFYLNSYHDGYMWSDDIMNGLREVFAASNIPIELQVEYMDSKKYNFHTLGEKLYELYRQKFSNEHFDVVIVSDNHGLDFIRQYRDELFPGVPVVFCGINRNDFEYLKDEPNMTGALETIEARALLELALKLSPRIKRMIAVGDRSTTGLAIKRQVESAMPDFEGRLEFEFMAVENFTRTLEELRDIPDDTMVYFIPFYTNVHGKFYSAEELVEVLSTNTDAPIYSNWGFLLGHGTVGGPLISGEDHGRAAANMALRILQGTRANRIPIEVASPHAFKFDYQVLKRLGIDMDLIPEGSIFINAPDAFYQLHKNFFWTIIVFLAVLVIVSLLLARNVVRRRVIEGKLKEQLAFMETLLDTIPLLICWKDTKQRYLGVNSSFVTFFGLRPGSVISHTDNELAVPQAYWREMQELDREVVETATPIRKHKACLRDPAGDAVWLEINKVPLRDPQGNVFGSLSTAENITREVLLERQLLQSQKMEAIGTLAGGIAHDFNNILTAIINSTELVLSDIPTDTLARRDLERVLSAANRGASVVKQILSFSRPTKEGFIHVNLADTVREVTNLLDRSLPRNITLQEDLPAVPATVYCDPAQMHQVLMNLCANSFQSLRETGGVIRVSLAREELSPDWAQALGISPGSHLRVSVEDNGPGIPSELMDKVFDPFFTTKGKAEGTGLGLAVVHGIVRAHKGAVRLQSIPWSETRMDIFLPMADTGEVCESDRGNTVHQGTGRLVFVEDDDDQLSTTPRLLEQLGYEVTFLKYPQRALEMIRDHGSCYDALITDFDMPGTNGLELARAVAEVAPRLPVILVSGREAALTPPPGLDNIKATLLKPYSKSDLSDALRKVLA